MPKVRKKLTRAMKIAQAQEHQRMIPILAAQKAEMEKSDVTKAVKLLHRMDAASKWLEEYHHPETIRNEELDNQADYMADRHDRLSDTFEYMSESVQSQARAIYREEKGLPPKEDLVTVAA